MIEMCDGFEPACTADSRQHRFGHAFGNAPSYLDMGKIQRTLKIDYTEYEFLDTPCSMADHIATRITGLSTENLGVRTFKKSRRRTLAWSNGN